MPVLLALWETKFKAGLAIYQGPGSKEGSGVGWTLVEQPGLTEDGDEYTSHHGDHSDGAPQHLVEPWLALSGTRVPPRWRSHPVTAHSPQAGIVTGQKGGPGRKAEREFSFWPGSGHCQEPLKKGE